MVTPTKPAKHIILSDITVNFKQPRGKVSMGKAQVKLVTENRKGIDILSQVF